MATWEGVVALVMMSDRTVAAKFSPDRTAVKTSSFSSHGNLQPALHIMLHQYRCGHFHTTHHAASIQVWSFPHYASRCINTGMIISTLCITLHQYQYGHFCTMHHTASIQVWSFPLYASCCINTGVVISALNVTLHQHRYGHFCTTHQCINTGMFIPALCITLHQYRYGHFCTKCHAASIQVNKWKVHMYQYPCAR